MPSATANSQRMPGWMSSLERSVSHFVPRRLDSPGEELATSVDSPTAVWGGKLRRCRTQETLSARTRAGGTSGSHPTPVHAIAFFVLRTSSGGHMRTHARHLHTGLVVLAGLVLLASARSSARPFPDLIPLPAD